MSATTLQGSVSERTGSDVDFSVRNLWKVFGPNAHKVANDESLAGLSATEILEQTGCVTAVRDISFDVARGCGARAS